MVATRNHPKDFEPLPTDSPTKRSTRQSLPSPTKNAAPRATQAPALVETITLAAPSSSSSSTKPTTAASSTAGAAARAGAWTHTPSNLTLIWLAVSLPLVIWDTGYVLLRPYSMPGGALHSPIWTPYELYGRVDHVYGWKAYNAKYGWTAAQGTFNLFETAAYLLYLYLVYAYGTPDPAQQGRGAPDQEKLGAARSLGQSRTLSGKTAAAAILIVYTTTMITFVKTILYWLIEAFSGFDGIGHNDTMSLIFLWIIPNGAWIVVPGYLLYVFGAEILQGLDAAVEPKKTQ